MPKRKNREGRRVTRLKREARELIQAERKEAAGYIQEYVEALQSAGKRIKQLKRHRAILGCIALITLISTGVLLYGI